MSSQLNQRQDFKKNLLVITASETTNIQESRLLQTEFSHSAKRSFINEQKTENIENEWDSPTSNFEDDTNSAQISPKIMALFNNHDPLITPECSERAPREFFKSVSSQLCSINIEQKSKNNHSEEDEEYNTGNTECEMIDLILKTRSESEYLQSKLVEKQNYINVSDFQSLIAQDLIRKNKELESKSNQVGKKLKGEVQLEDKGLQVSEKNSLMKNQTKDILMASESRRGDSKDRGYDDTHSRKNYTQIEDIKVQYSSETTQNLINSKQGMIKNLEKQLKNSEERHKLDLQFIEEKEELIKMLKNDNKAIESRYGKSVSTKKKEIENLKNKLSEMEMENIINHEDLNHIESYIQKFCQKQESILKNKKIDFSNFQDFSFESNSQNKTITTLHDYISNLHKQCSEVSNQASRLKSDLESKEDRISSQKNLKSEIENLKNERNGIKVEVRMLKEKVNRLSSDLDSNNSKVQDKNRLLHKIQQEVSIRSKEAENKISAILYDCNEEISQQINLFFKIISTINSEILSSKFSEWVSQKMRYRKLISESNDDLKIQLQKKKVDMISHEIEMMALEMKLSERESISSNSDSTPRLGVYQVQQNISNLESRNDDSPNFKLSEERKFNNSQEKRDTRLKKDYGTFNFGFESNSMTNKIDRNHEMRENKYSITKTTTTNTTTHKHRCTTQNQRLQEKDTHFEQLSEELLTPSKTTQAKDNTPKHRVYQSKIHISPSQLMDDSQSNSYESQTLYLKTNASKKYDGDIKEIECDKENLRELVHDSNTSLNKIESIKRNLHPLTPLTQKYETSSKVTTLFKRKTKRMKTNVSSNTKVEMASRTHTSVKKSSSTIDLNFIQE